MRDLVFVAIVLAFFAVAAAYVVACGAIVGRQDDGGGDLSEDGDVAPRVTR